MSLKLHQFADATRAADALAAEIGTALQRSVDATGTALLLVSGGRSPLPLFAALARLALPWSQIAVSLVDERCVASDHADSNTALIKQHLLTDRASAARWIALMDDALARSAGDGMQIASSAAQQANQNPALAHATVVVLGMGNDGHTASLFADAAEWPQARTTSARYVAVQPGQAAHARVGLSLHALLEQGRCYVWASGSDKHATLTRLAALVDGASGDAAQDQLADAGALALLIAAPQVVLDVYQSL